MNGAYVSNEQLIKLRVYDTRRKRKILKPVTVIDEGNQWALKFDYDEDLLKEIKTFQGAKWHGYDKTNPRPLWTVAKNRRNKFRFDFLRMTGEAGEVNPYAKYDKPLIQMDLNDRPYYEHQKPGIQILCTYRQVVLAWEMGTGKTLVVIKAMEWASENLGYGPSDFVFVCKKSALFQVTLDFEEWRARVIPTFYSYDAMKIWVRSLAKRGSKGYVKPPRFIVLDESTMIKDPGSQRSEAAFDLAEMSRDEWGDEAFIIEMSGAPAPKDPGDWWHQGEVACPGFVREGDINKFKQKMAVIRKMNKDDGTGNYFNKIVTWRDDEKKCNVCGSLEHAAIHSEERRLDGSGHHWKASVNEVQALYSRLKGLVHVKFKKDCMDLPKRVYRTIRCKPTQQMLNAAKIIIAKARGAAQALTLLRELSDGFQYQDNQESGEEKTCPTCSGIGTQVLKFDPENPTEPLSQEAIALGRFEERLGDCDECSGAGVVPILRRGTNRMPCPKDEALEEIIEEHNDVGRLVTYAGFTGSVDRVTEVYLKSKWSVLRVDGRGWHVLNGQGAKNLLPPNGKEAYKIFRHEVDAFPKVAFVAQASTAAHGLNFDCCPTMVFYSNDFNFENRIQADERNMRGRIAETLVKHGREHVLVLDLVHLEADMVVLKNHKAKRKLQSLTMGDLRMALGPEV